MHYDQVHPIKSHNIIWTYILLWSYGYVYLFMSAFVCSFIAVWLFVDGEISPFRQEAQEDFLILNLQSLQPLIVSQCNEKDNLSQSEDAVFQSCIWW